eukprot:CAMPEP_0174722350 /NCGR_PEP_ID=MMETSP1094-20130205/38254_1 /TAXON_ID=156173 /ORGANISM="Chrysochromulina brevifilum, Strain UTEX LB 985" /LENGTH=80 /DNA_ID=CAMNT_0015923193 /DNA_START=102 /DNA_END=345 /DNA_ORIENTATION=-
MCMCKATAEQTLRISVKAHEAASHQTTKGLRIQVAHVVKVQPPSGGVGTQGGVQVHPQVRIAAVQMNDIIKDIGGCARVG